ncbi:hypothetical protein B0J14DRAFT_558585 [Halenospora varia]|nr:hypothetical protein B0J14DRAFT_558585 [Halenospora varia]
MSSPQQYTQVQDFSGEQVPSTEPRSPTTTGPKPPSKSKRRCCQCSGLFELRCYRNVGHELWDRKGHVCDNCVPLIPLEEDQESEGEPPAPEIVKKQKQKCCKCNHLFETRCFRNKGHKDYDGNGHACDGCLPHIEETQGSGSQPASLNGPKAGALVKPKRSCCQCGHLFEDRCFRNQGHGAFDGNGHVCEGCVVLPLTAAEAVEAET